EAVAVRAGPNLTLNGADTVVQPLVPVVIRHVLDGAEQLPHTGVGQPREPLPVEEDRRTVVGLEHPAERGLERAVDTTARIVRSTVPRREAGLRPAHRAQRALRLCDA